MADDIGTPGSHTDDVEMTDNPERLLENSNSTVTNQNKEPEMDDEWARRENLKRNREEALDDSTADVQKQQNEIELLRKKQYEGEIEIAQFIQENNIKSLEELKSHFDAAREACEKEAEDNRDVCQRIKRQLQQSETMVFELRHQLSTAKLKLDSEKERYDRLQRKMAVPEENAIANSLIRRGRETSNQKNVLNEPVFQTTVCCSGQETSTPRKNVTHYGEHFNIDFKNMSEKKEKIRAYNESTDEIYDTQPEESHNNCTKSLAQSQNNIRARNVYENNDFGHMSMMNQKLQIQMEMSIPDPLKFSGERNTISAETFMKTFFMKFARFDSDYQVLLLETKFLSGKALKAYKGLPSSSKGSVVSVMKAIQSRLQISGPDESRRAKTQLNELKMSKNQSVQDFCLELDELARRGFQGTDDYTLSSLKTAKLMSELGQNTVYDTLIHMLHSSMQVCPEEDHYEMCREQATRFDLNLKEREKRVKSDLNEKKADEQHANTHEKQNTVSQQHNMSAQPRHSQQYNCSPFAHSNARPFWSMTGWHYQNAQNDQQNSQNTWAQKIQQSERNENNSYVLPSSNSENAEQSCDYSGNNVSTNQLGFRKCSECNLIGCHDNNCSKAPQAARVKNNQSVTCFTCNEKDHYSTVCPLKNNKNSPSSSLNTQVSGKEMKIETIGSKKSEDIHVSETEGSPGSVIIENGRIEKAKVNLLVDSGACISVIGINTWKEIVKKNGGAKWEREAIIKKKNMIKVHAANNQPMKLLFQVKVKTSMQSRTRDLLFYVSAVEREDIILGIDQFENMGIRLKIDENPRDVKITRNVILDPGESKLVLVSVEGVVNQKSNWCLLTPKVPSISQTHCQVSGSGEAWLQFSNRSSEPILLKGGEIVATGEMEKLEVVEEKPVYSSKTGIKSRENGHYAPNETKSDKELVNYENDKSLRNEGHNVVIVCEKEVADGKPTEISKVLLQGGNDQLNTSQQFQTPSADEKSVMSEGKTNSEKYQNFHASFTHELKTGIVGVNRKFTDPNISGKCYSGAIVGNQSAQTLNSGMVKQQNVYSSMFNHEVIYGLEDLTEIQEDQMFQQHLNKIKVIEELKALNYKINYDSVNQKTGLSSKFQDLPPISTILSPNRGVKMRPQMKHHSSGYPPDTDEISLKEDSRKHVFSSILDFPKLLGKPGVKKEGDGTCGGFFKKTIERKRSEDIHVKVNAKEKLCNMEKMDVKSTKNDFHPLKDPPDKNMEIMSSQRGMMNRMLEDSPNDGNFTQSMVSPYEYQGYVRKIVTNNGAEDSLQDVCQQPLDNVSTSNYKL